ncbi:Olfactory receptor 5B2 [Myotis brandtii]|uniref:Olfactory receptor n=1 Tax=Myotis brandtii TaxID=109478 RepID=S7PGC9_MYOBR|nr:PREDICTED: olfactory receptor 5B2 [Myotis brandtii]EPQ09663.1 Olfactory receptor 5B2 [Myotis brandtii]
MENRTKVTHFILLGLTNAPELQVPLFIMFTIIYLTNVVGNLGMIALILLDSRLHTPMYFFLSNLSLVDFAYSSAVTPKVMAGLLIGNKVISYNACAAQMFFFVAFATVENYLLASMAYDRYAAVCKPLHYTTTMTTGVCSRLAVGSYICGFLNASFHVGDIFSLFFCMSNLVHHFFCDVPAVMALSCSATHRSEVFLVFMSSFNVFFALLVILISYLFIFITILKMHSPQGHQKALSTCASHLTTVSIFYGTVIFMYLQPSSNHSMDTDKVASVFYSMVIPMLNPLVYSLRNKEVKSAFKKVVEKAHFSIGLGI